jgi:hypothetical protein
MRIALKHRTTEQVNEFASEEGAEDFMREMQKRGEHRDWQCIDYPGKAEDDARRAEYEAKAAREVQSVATTSGLLGSTSTELGASLQGTQPAPAVVFADPAGNAVAPGSNEASTRPADEQAE